MKPIHTTSQKPLLIGGSSPLGCSLLGNFINSLSNYDCGPPTNFFCHPAMWQDDSSTNSTWGEHCSQSLKKLTDAGEQFLPWSKIRTKNIEPYYHRNTEAFDFLETSASISEFAETFFTNRLTVSSAVSWAEATPENCFAASPFLKNQTKGQVILVVENGYSAMRRLISEGFSPKVAAKIWTCETTLSLDLQNKHSLDRVLLLRLEDLLSSPLTELDKIIIFLNTEKESATTQLTDHSQLEKMTDAACQNALKTHLAQGSQLKQEYKHYLLGTYPKESALEKFDCDAPPAAASNLLFRLGYEDSIQIGEPVSLNKNEQLLGSPRASFINRLADYTKTPHKLSSRKSTNSTPKHPALRFWKKKHQSPELRLAQKNDSDISSQFPFFESDVPYGMSLDNEQDSNNHPDLDPQLNNQTLDLAVVIGFYGRHQVLELVIRELVKLEQQGYSIAVFLTCSNTEDYQFAQKLKAHLPCIGVRQSPNHPLGQKWQAGVDFARKFSPRHLLITGSDDMVSQDFLIHAMQLLSEDAPSGGFEFAAPASWFIYEISDDSHQRGTLWEVAYVASIKQPLGAGRVYSSRLLDRIDWKLFENTLNVGLDTFGYNQIINSNAQTVLIPSNKGVILSIKGSWQAMNSTETILSVPTIQNRPCDFEKEVFFEKHFQTTSSKIRKSISY
ncbi:MAG: hypothetical protein L3J39_16735 [Verrucomicrobiales bacterium]|nr:hypothetical protein [Verrucomicrobiales bacterium]